MLRFVIIVYHKYPCLANEADKYSQHACMHTRVYTKHGLRRTLQQKAPPKSVL